MPRFYFDFNDGGAADDEGCEMKDDATACSEALSVLLTIARDDMQGDDRALTARVRDESDKVVFQATLSVVGRRPS